MNSEQKFIAFENDVFAIGDWNISPRVESAFLSGKALAKFLVSNIK
jgi:predicted NAD/FAD-dependent oxidoreductase